MSEPSIAHPTTAANDDARLAAWLIGGLSLLAVLMMAHHPTIRSQDMSDVAAELVRSAGINQFVHASLVVMLVALFLGLLEFSGRLGLRQPMVRAALIAYGVGTLGMIVAAVFSGFVAPELGAIYLGKDPAELEALRHSLRLSHAINQGFAAIAVVARSTAIVLWSVVLVRARKQWLFGVVGIAAVLPALGVMAGLLRLDVHGAMLALLGEVIWNIAIAVQLLRRRL